MPDNNTLGRSRIWVVIPVFNNKKTVFDIAGQCRRKIDQVLVVDDGSTDTDVEILFRATDIIVLKHERNLGKGMALRTALRYIAAKGAEYMITLDADGQHDPRDIDRFIPMLTQDGSAIIVGTRDFNTVDIPERSRFGRAFSNFWLRLESGASIDDSQSGFRAYPVQYLSRMRLDGRHYDFEIEVLTRAVWSGLDLRQVGIKVFYPPAGTRISHFRPFLDNLRISLMHARLVGRRLLPFPYPRLIKRVDPGFQPDLLMHPVKLLKMLLKENATPIELAVSAAVGIFLGVLPLLSVHILTTLYVTSRLHLNKVMAVGIQNICMPPFVPVACIELGHFMLYRRWLTDVTWKTVFGEIPVRLWEWLLGSLLVAPVLSILTGVVVYCVSRSIQKKHFSHASA